MSALSIEIAAVGAVAIGGLVAIGRTWARRRARSRPAREDDQAQRRATLRQIAASEYRPKRHEKDRP